MRRLLGAAVSLAMIGAVGCGDAATTTSTTPAATPVLLTLDDLDAGWRAGPETGEADLVDLATAIRMPCPDVGINPTIATRLAPSAAVQFESADGTSRHLIESVTIGGPGRLGLDVEVWIGGLDACVARGANPDEGLVRFERMTLPALGDQRAAFLQVATEEPGSPPYWWMRTAIVRVDRVLIIVGVIEVVDAEGSQPTFDDAAFVDLVTDAVDLVTP